ncbi:HlyD family secretion protein [Microvirga tunisiensis]|uniref:HlyD family efflux transporter periplasmic adaptor subunit n=1 Tax=Microvirga tunisiensis TaxID=2108360 RepID=A0A5N7MK44_9HYPH|nr:HlyD family efflux transporter periplasmic adaptor subunit [Microvirga tunisiensis]MPR10353.1 HlyD family efflux transporter periplasmic adaptor subunit [Microvirga tunisiensis]MPR27452.1 HlyD family efflux transporter periplasmic adaptor subunit [Microvirga tunisiensis]
MKTARLIVFAVLLLAGGAAAWFFWPKSDDTIRFQGYVEGYLVFMAPEEGGRIEELTVDSGDRVAEGTMLFRLDASVQSAQRNEAAAKLQQTRAQLANLEAALRRPEEIAVLEAQEERAQAQLGLSQAELDRQRTLFERGIAAKAQYDQARTAFERDKAALAEVQRQIDAGQIAGRSGEIGAAEAAVQANEAALMQAETRLAKRQVKAPSDAQVQDVYFRAGETVNGGQPVLALLPPANRRIRFYVPEPLLATIALGQTVGLSCDSCKDGLQARISFISSEAEFTPPVIFSEQERAKLVFRVEARPLDGANLPIGLPVTVTPAEPEPRS